MKITELTSARLLLRPFVPGDAATVRELTGVRAVAAPIDGLPHPYPGSAAITWIAGHAAEAAAGVALSWAIVRHRDSVLLGAVSLRVSTAHQRGEIGYWIGRPYWNQGFATEAVGSVVAHAFSSLSLHRIQAFCLPENIGSVRVLEKIGFQPEGVLQDYVLRWGHFQDRAVYGLLAEDWIH